MSEALYNLGGLRFWNEREIRQREQFIDLAVFEVREALLSLNPAWSFWRCEGPCLSPRDQISNAYTNDDLFVTNHRAGGGLLALRAETTPSSYAFARYIMAKEKRARAPLCVWQAGKSFRRETNDGASAAKLRFNEFYQLEFQCIYRADTKADYRAALIAELAPLVERFTTKDVRVVESDRLPSYSESTLDLEVDLGIGPAPKWREVASCSIRTDFADDMRVCEIAIGLDRIVEVSR